MRFAATYSEKLSGFYLMIFSTFNALISCRNMTSRYVRCTGESVNRFYDKPYDRQTYILTH